MYCVYITTYSGTALPKKYIGSSSVQRIEKGYCGSVRSKKWKSIWENQLKFYPELFTVDIVSIHSTRSAALEEEFRLQRVYDVVKSDEWINQGYAQVNGYAGRNVSGVNNPMYGQGHKQREWCAKNPEKVSERNRKAAVTQWGNDYTRRKRISNMVGRSKSRKTMTQEEFCILQQNKNKISVSVTCDVIEFNGAVYYGWRDLLLKTGVTKHLYRKYYVNGMNPLDRKGLSGPIPHRL